MSVASRNPFAILDEDSSRPSTPPPTSNPAPSTQPPATRGNQRGRGRGGPASRGGKYYPRGGTRNSGAQPTDEEPAEGVEKKKFDGESRGRGRGRGGRGRGEGRGEGRGGRGRAFDRHSATGKTDSDKKLHQSWGGDDGVAELQTEEAATKDATVEQTGTVVEDNAWGASAPADDAWAAPAATDDAWAAPVSAPAEDSWGAPAADAAPADGDKNEGRRGREREPEEPDNTLTLDQYLQQQKDKGFSVPKLEARKANEGADDALWKGAVELQKKDEDETAYFVGKQTKSAPKSRAKKEEKVFLEIDARFERPSRGGRGRGGERGGDRGGDRGGRGRSRGDRGGRNRANGAPSLDVDDEKAFPSLS